MWKGNGKTRWEGRKKGGRREEGWCALACLAYSIGGVEDPRCALDEGREGRGIHSTGLVYWPGECGQMVFLFYMSEMDVGEI